MSTYNGWPNRATWKASLYCESKNDVVYLKEHLEEMLSTLPLPISDFLQEAYNDVDWEYLLDSFSDEE